MVSKQKCLVLVCIFLIISLATNIAAVPNEENHPKQKVLVLFSDDAKPELVEKYGKITHKFSLVNGVAAEIGEEGIEALKAEQGIRKIEPDLKVYAFPLKIRPVLPRDLPKKSLRGRISPPLEATSVAPAWNLEAQGIDVVGAWNYSLDGSGIKIAILDTGVNYNLQDLDDNYLGGYNFVKGNDDPMDNDRPYGHGTLVASVAVGEGVEMIVGVAPSASYYALKVLDKNGEGWVSDIIEGIGWAVNNDADVISMSFGGSQYLTAFEEAVNNAYNSGLILVGASGNEGYTYSIYPAAFQNVISVGAHAQDQTIPSFSNWGVDVVAPGVDIIAMGMNGVRYYASGTSFSAPHVSAAIALEKQYANLQSQTRTNPYFWQTLKQAATDLGFSEEMQGSGKVDIDYAIDLIANNWFINYVVRYLNYVYIDWQGYPAYYIGRNMHYQIDITNNQNKPINNLKVIATQAYYNHMGNVILPGNPVEEFTISLNPGQTTTLDDYYYIPWGSYPGLDRTEVTLETSSYPVANILTDSTAGIWCPPQE